MDYFGCSDSEDEAGPSEASVPLPAPPADPNLQLGQTRRPQPNLQMSPAEVVQMCEQLVRAYQPEPFQKQLSETMSSNPTDLRQVLGSLTLRAQTPVLHRWGFEASTDGVWDLKETVLHSIANGNSPVVAVANQALELLGLKPTHGQQSWQQIVSKNLQEVASLEEMVASTPILLQKLLNLDLLTTECQEWLHTKRTEGCGVTALITFSNYGRLKLPLDLWHCTADAVPTLQSPSIEELWWFVSRNVPVVIRGAADNFPVLRHLNDHQYMRAKFGHRQVKVKVHQGGTADQIFAGGPAVHMPFSHWLDLLDQKKGPLPYYPGKMALRQEIPELAAEIDQHPHSPREAYRECFGDLIPQGPFMYFGAGGQTTNIHYDPHENLCLCTRGLKRFQLFPPSDTERMLPIKAPGYSLSALPCFQPLDGASVQPATVPTPTGWKPLGELTRDCCPIEVSITAGEVLYLPMCWWHGVTAGNTSNMIINWWLGMHEDKQAPS